MKKKYVVMLAAMLTLGILLTGCGSKNSSSDNNVPPVNNTGNVNGSDDAGNANDVNSTEDVDGTNDAEDVNGANDAEDANDVNNTDDADASDNEDSGEVHELAQNDVMHSVFFDLQVNSVETADALEEWVPHEGYTFLIVNVSITNTFGADIPMSYVDFPALWNDGEDGTYPDSDFSIAFPEQYVIAEGATETGNLIYSVPLDQDEVVIEYYDLFTNGTRGDTFNLHIAVN